MIKTFFHRISLSALLLAAVLASACSPESSIMPIENEPETNDMVMLSLNIKTADYSPATSRATNSPDYFEPPTGDFEKIETLRVIITDPSGNVEANRQVALDAVGNPIGDRLVFEVKGNQQKNVYLIANGASLPSPVEGLSTPQWLDQVSEGSALPKKTIDNWSVSLDLSEGVATSSLFNPNDPSSRLPQCEQFTFMVADRFTTLDETGYKTQKANLFLTRACPKATFNVKSMATLNLSEAGMPTTITQIKLNGINQTQYVFAFDAIFTPSKYDANQMPTIVGNRYISYFEPYPNTPGIKVGFSIPVSIPIIRNTDVSVGPIYFPASMVESAGEHFSVEIMFDNGFSMEAPLTTNILSVKGLDAIARNTHLIINIDTDPYGTPFLIVDLVPYREVILNPDFGV